MRVKDLMIEPSPGVYHHACLGTLSRTLVQYDTGAVLILADDGSMLGIVTDGDLFRRRRCENHSFLECLTHAIANDEPCPCLESASDTCAASIMSHPVISVAEDAELSFVADLLLQHGIRRIPVTRDGRPVGMLGRRNVLRALLAEAKLSDPVS